jgi:hydroxymethylbilane synthase
MDRGGLLDEVDLIHRTGLPVGPVRTALKELGEVDWVAVTSPYTVDTLSELGLLEVLSRGPKRAAVGPSSHRALRKLSLSVDLVPTQGSSGAALAEVFPQGPGHVLIPGARETAGTLEAGLEAKGWKVTTLPVYATQGATTMDKMVSTRWDEGDYEVFIATSPSTAKAAAYLLGPTVPTVAIGPSSYACAMELGFPKVLQSPSANPDDLVATCAMILEDG